jgi:hypothetical protein
VCAPFIGPGRERRAAASGGDINVGHFGIERKRGDYGEGR